MPLSSYVIDNGLAAMQSLADKVYICSAQPATYTEATSTFALGNKNWGAGNALTGPADGTSGRKVTTVAITDGAETAAGTATWFAVVDSANSRLLSTDQLSASVSISGIQQWTMASVDILIPGGLMDLPNTGFFLVQRDGQYIVESDYYATQYDADAYLWMREATATGGSVTETRLSTVSTLVSGLKTDGVWTKLDRLWLFAANDQASALVDLVARSMATAVGSPTFTTDRGYTGTDADPATKYIDTLYNPATTATNFTQNAAHLSAWSLTNTTAANGGCLAGSGDTTNVQTNIFDTYTDGNVYGRVNDSTPSGSQGSPGTRIGQWIINRSGASATQLYQNGSLFNSPNQSSGTVFSNTLLVLAFGANSAAKFGTPNQVAMCSVGGSLSSTDVTNFYSRLRTYMTAVGVP